MAINRREKFWFEQDGSVIDSQYRLFLFDLPQAKKLVLFSIHTGHMEIAITNATACRCDGAQASSHRHVVHAIGAPFTQAEIDDLFSYMDELAN